MCPKITWLWKLANKKLKSLLASKLLSKCLVFTCTGFLISCRTCLSMWSKNYWTDYKKVFLNPFAPSRHWSGNSVCIFV
jgi:hypothetical protein